MQEICDKNKCSGCAACMNVCGKHAINMQPDEQGFFFPTINNTLCVDCGLCLKVCPVNNPPSLNYPIQCYAATLPDSEDLKKSASGGAGTAFARYVIANGGVVYGCSGKDITHVHHIRVDKLEDVELLRGSKYVQSEIGDVFTSLLTDLKNGLTVLFVGTPCQVAGLKGLLRKDYNNLITVDLVCHGVPSQQMLNDNISYYTGKKKSNDLKLDFRRKVVEKRLSKLNFGKIEFGWFLSNHPYSESALKWYDDSYMLGFISCLTFRNSCYSCRYATACRVSDITIADFWGIGKDAGMDIGKGVSSCLINTSRGSEFFSVIKDNLHVVEREPVEAILGNGQLQSPSHRPIAYNVFNDLYPLKSFKDAIDKSLKKKYIKVKYVAPVINFISVLRKCLTKF